MERGVSASRSFFEGGYIELSIGERICFFRNKRGLTQEQLGRLIGLPDNSADVRITQYESGSRKPKGDVIKALAEVFGISPFALSISDIETIHSSFCIRCLQWRTFTVHGLKRISLR